MRLIILATVLFMAASIARSQAKPFKSACLDPEPASGDVILTVCNHEHGMVALPQPRLFVRVYADGRGEIETNKSSTENPYAEQVLIKKQFKVSADEIDGIRRLGRASDFQASKDSYPAYVIATDSSLASTLSFHDQGKIKKTTLVNFSPVSVDNKEHYGLSLTRLMALAMELHDHGQGIFREPPTITFCDLMKNREWFVNSEIGINADLEYSEERKSISDPECEAPGMGTLFTNGKIWVSFSQKHGKADELLRKALTLSTDRFGGRARVYMFGILREDTSRPAEAVSYRFEITDFKTIEPIYLPFRGRLEAGRMYSDTIESRLATKFGLSSTLKMPAHHAARIEWTNDTKFPAFRAYGQKYVTFRVISAAVEKITSSRWNTVYTCEILNVKRAPYLD